MNSGKSPPSTALRPSAVALGLAAAAAAVSPSVAAAAAAATVPQDIAAQLHHPHAIGEGSVARRHRRRSGGTGSGGGRSIRIYLNPRQHFVAAAAAGAEDDEDDDEVVVEGSVDGAAPLAVVEDELEAEIFEA